MIVAAGRIGLPDYQEHVAQQLPMLMVWHQRYQTDPAHLRLCEQLEQTCRLLAAAASTQV
jgi:hypothetical protein